MIYCPRCGYQNSNTATYCKNCGEPIIPNQTYPRNYTKPKESNNKVIIISITIILVVLIIAGTVLLLSNNNQNANTPTNTPINIPENQDNTNTSNDTQPTQTQTTQTQPVQAQTTQTNTPLKILSGNFKTGSSLSDKTYITVYVGEEHAGEKVKIRVLYTRDGSQLNPGNIVPKTVDNSGTFTMASANSFKYYPDHAYITLYDANENIVDSKEVYMNPSSGTQTF